MTVRVRLQRRNYSTLALLIVVTLAIVAVAGVSRLMGPGATACSGVAEGAIVESQDFTPWESRRSHLPEYPINPSGSPLAPIPADSLVPNNTLDGLPLQWASVGGNGALVRYFWGVPLGPTVTAWNFWDGGGIELERSLVEGWAAADYASEIGERAQIVGVGSYEGVLTWADPGPNGGRPHHLSWSDGTYTYTLIAERSAARVVNLARGMVCG